MLVEQHAGNERERVAAQQLVGGGVLGEPEGHVRDPAAPRGDDDAVRPEAAGGGEAVLVEAGMRSTGQPLGGRMIDSSNEERA